MTFEPSSSAPRDAVPQTPPPAGREPFFNIPATTFVFIGLIVAVHAVRMFLDDATDFRLVMDFAFVPARLMLLLDPETARTTLQGLVRSGAQAGGDQMAALQGMLASYVLEGDAKVATLLTYAGLHGGWDHVAVNALWLAVFGSPVDHRFGMGRFIILCVFSAVAGALAQLLVDPWSLAPVIGASAVVSGCTGAAARFAFAPGGPLGPWRVPGLDAFRQPAPRLADVLSDRRAITFIGIWFLLNFVVGFGAQPLGFSDMPVAWMAHVGGFLAGLLGFSLLDPVKRQPPGIV